MSARARPRASEFLLSGMVQCGWCGSPMGGGTDHRNARREGSHGHGREWRHYRCINKSCAHRLCVGAEQLETRVRQVVCEQIVTSAQLRGALTVLQERLAAPELPEEIAGLKARIGATKRAIGNLIDAMEAGGADPEREQRYRQRKAELARQETDLQILEARQATAVAVVSDADLATIVEGMREGINCRDVARARAALLTFVAKVEVKDEEFRLEYDPGLLVHGFSQVPPMGFEPMYQA